MNTPKSIALSNGYSLLIALPLVAKKANVSVESIIGLRPEDGSGKCWLYTVVGKNEQFIRL